MKAIQLPPLPYDKNALAPYISEETLEYHYGKHHQAYVDNLNKLITNTDLEGKTLEEVIMAVANDSSKQGVFNNAAQVWNHTFYWNSMRKGGGGKPSGRLAQQIEKDFSSFEEFRELFKQCGMTQFGSGWAWLCWDSKLNTLVVLKTANAELPMMQKLQALITADVWEHAYYLDYQNRRPEYLDMFLNSLVNWEFAEKNFDNIVR